MKKTTFENLPNEILINIIEYIASPVAIYRCFHKLNNRFDHILRCVRLNLDIFMEDPQSLLILRYFSTYCNRLRVDTVCPSISLEKFPQLRSLTMIEPTDSQINSIQSQTLPMLEYLSCPVSMIIYDCLFGNEEEQWKYLYSCNFYFSHFPNSKLNWKINRIVNRLEGITCSRLTLSQLLSLLPCLKHLRVDMISNDLSNWNLTIFNKTLLSLRIGFNNLNYDDLMILFNENLQRLYIDLYCEHLSINFNYLGNLLINLTPKLRQFNCDYRGREKSIENIKYSHKFFQNIKKLNSSSNDIFRLVCRDMIF